jgi:hypothetical protein
VRKKGQSQGQNPKNDDNHILPTWEANLLAREANPLAQDVLTMEVSEEPSSHDQEALSKQDDVHAFVNMSMANSLVYSSSELNGVPY